MIVEGLEYIVTPCQPWSRRAGFLYQMIALRARYRRNKVAWKSHIEACHNFVIKAAEMTDNNGRAIVLGSGLLIETPISYLANKFREVILVDAIHGIPERCRMRKYKNVNMVEADISGIINNFSRNSHSKFDISKFEYKYDLAISSNMLSQIPLYLHDALNTMKLGCNEETIKRRAIIDHIITIKSISHHHCLISDYEHYITNNELIVDTKDLLYGIMLPPPSETWTWNLALRPELFQNKDVYSRVGAWVDINDMALS